MGALLPALEANARAGAPSRVVSQSSVFHRYMPFRMRDDVDDEQKYEQWRAYARNAFHCGKNGCHQLKDLEEPQVVPRRIHAHSSVRAQRGGAPPWARVTAAVRSFR